MWNRLKRYMFGGYLQEKGLINQLNHTWTPVILILLSVLAIIARYVENPVECWCPHQFPSQAVKYTNNICWKSDWVYIMPDEEDVVPLNDDREAMWRNMYWLRWLPMVFLLQAFLFRIPGMVLHVGESKLGFNRNRLCGLSDGYSKLSLEDRKNVGKQLSRYLNQWLKNRILSGLPVGFLTFLVVFVYVLYVINITVQLTILDKFIKHPNATSYGTHLSQNLFENLTDERVESPVFFRMFLCDFQIRQLQATQRWTVQCVNNMNYVYEQIMALQYIWLLFVIVVTYCSCALKAVEVVIPFIRTRYIKHFLQSVNIMIQNQSDVSRFANTFLGEDGVMVLKGIGEMSSEYLVRDAVVNLWVLNYGDRGHPQHSGMSGATYPQQTIQPGSATSHQPGISQHQAGNQQYPDNRPGLNIYPRCSETPATAPAENVPLISVSTKEY